MSKRVVITGLGCISPVGNDVPSMWNCIQAGKSGIDLITHYDTSEFESKLAGEVKGFDGAQRFGNREARRMDRCTQFALAAEIEALQDSGLEINDDNREQIGVVIRTGIRGAW